MTNMISKAELSLEGNTYSLNKVIIEISQEADKFGRPSSITKGGKIEIELNSAEDEIILDWMIQAKKMLSGNIQFYEADYETKIKVIKFENAYCIAYNERFHKDSNESIITELMISAEKLSIGSIDLDNNWPK